MRRVPAFRVRASISPSITQGRVFEDSRSRGLAQASEEKTLERPRVNNKKSLFEIRSRRIATAFIARPIMVF